MFVVNLTKKEIDVFGGGLTPNDYIVNFGYNMFKFVASGTLLNQLVDSDPKTFYVAHGLSYTPNLDAVAEYQDGKIATSDMAQFSYQPFVVDDINFFTAEVDATYLRFTFTRPGANYYVDISYVVFEVPL